MFMPTTQSQCYAAASLMGRGTRDDTGDEGAHGLTGPRCAVDARDGDTRVRWNGYGQLNSNWGGDSLGWLAVCSVAPPSPPPSLPPALPPALPPSPPRALDSLPEEVIIGIAAGGACLVVVVVVALIFRCHFDQRRAASNHSTQSGGQQTLQTSTVQVQMASVAATVDPPMGQGLPVAPYKDVYAQGEVVGTSSDSPPVATMVRPMAAHFPRKFDPMTGKPLPKFDPYTGVQNW